MTSIVGVVFKMEVVDVVLNVEFAELYDIWLG